MNQLIAWTALLLGLRHGVDLDHVAAIADFVAGNCEYGSSNARALAPSRAKICWLAIMYVLGHAITVVVLGSVFVLFRPAFPVWLDSVMEKIVGVSLIALGSWIAYGVFDSLRDPQKTIRCRGRVLLGAMSRIWRRCSHEHEHQHVRFDSCDWKCAIAIGVIHGLGAETGTQILLISALGRVHDLAANLTLLASFVVGMLAANLSMSMAMTEGYKIATASNRWQQCLGALCSAFSVSVGLSMVAA